MLKDIFASISKPKAGPIEYVIVGLGNPGIQYEGTRHNVGFMVLDYIAKQCNVSIDRMKFKGMTCDTILNGKRVLLLKPMTYMNLSGDSVRDAMNFYKLTPDRVIVVYDDISLQPGKLRIRLKGSHGGQLNNAEPILSPESKWESEQNRIPVGIWPIGYCLNSVRRN